MEAIINGIKINYVKKGEGTKKILLLHGWGSNIKLFNNIINFLSKKYTVYAIDMPGFGLSEMPPDSWNVDNYIEFIMEYIKVMQIESLSLLGHSFGGRIIIKLNSRKDLPFKIEKNILVDSAGIKHKKKITVKNIIYKISKKILGNKYIKQTFPKALEKLKKNFGSEDYKNAVPVMRDTLVKVVNEDLSIYLPKIKVPTLIIWGTKDTATPIEDALLMEKLIPDAGVVKIEGAGHYSFLENPQLVNSVLESFLNS